jgi:aryl-alcohol dehydrogenase-like predicted oxidoreductase
MYARCRDAGINLFDCADVYADGRSEEILGGLVRGHRDEVVVATKGYFPTGPGPNDRGGTRFHLVRAVEASLRRLNTDRIDLYYLHRMDDQTPLDQTLRALDDLVRQGKIVYVGVSNFAAWQVAKALGVAALRGFTPLVAIQPMYNLLKRQAEVEILPMAASEGVGVLPYSPLAGGLLSGKYGVDRRPDAGRIVDNKMYGVRYGAAGNFSVAEKFCALASELGHHPVSLAVRWVATHPAVTAPLIGARNLAQLEPALQSVQIEMDHALRDRISALSTTPSPATDRNEEKSTHNYGSR